MKAYKQTVRKYYKYIISPWTQPILTQNGVMGGDSFAVDSSSYSVYSGGHPAWRAFDNNTATYFVGGNIANEWYDIYSPEPLRWQKLTITNAGNYEMKDYEILASNNREDWIFIKTGSNDTMGTNSWDIDLDANGYKYLRLNLLSHLRGDGISSGFSEIKISAIHQEAVESTIDDYDFYKDVEIYKLSSYPVFDRRKFTVVGTPTITDDGIASGFSNSNYIELNNPLKGNKFTIETKITKPSDTSIAEQLIFQLKWNFLCFFLPETNEISFCFPTTDGSATLFRLKVSTSTFNTGDNIYIRITSNGDSYKSIELSKDGKNWNVKNEHTSTSSSFDVSSLSTITLGKISSSSYLTSSIDLKQFSIEVDDKEVLRGTKTLYKAFNI